MIPKGNRRLIAFLSAIVVTVVPDIAAGIGLSTFTAGALIAESGLYFAGVAADKLARSKFGQGEEEG